MKKFLVFSTKVGSDKPEDRIAINVQFIHSMQPLSADKTELRLYDKFAADSTHMPTLKYTILEPMGALLARIEEN